MEHFGWPCPLSKSAYRHCHVLLRDLWFAFREDRQYLKIPKKFAELQALNALLKKYRDIYPYRIIICYVTTYFLYVNLPLRSVSFPEPTSPP